MKKEKKTPEKLEEVGLSSFLSSGYCTFLCVLKGCQINVFPTESQAFAGNHVCMKIILTIFCLHMELLRARISNALCKVNVIIIPILQPVKCQD